MPIDILGPDRQSRVTADTDTFVGADLRNLNLESADCQNMDLRGVDLRGSKLRGCQFMRANLTGANLTGCYLRGVHFHDAILTGARLDNVTIDWFSPHLVSELLKRAATNASQAAFATHGVEHKLCWEQLLALDHSEADWAIRVLAPYVRPDDNAPKFLRDAANRTS